MIGRIGVEWFWAQSAFNSLGDRFRGRRLELTDLLLVIGTAGGVALLLYLASRYLARTNRQGPYNHPRRLFQELCRAHGLHANERRLLIQLAKQHKVSQASVLFLQPARFDLARLPADWTPRGPELAALRSRLFSTQAIGGADATATVLAAD